MGYNHPARFIFSESEFQIYRRLFELREAAAVAAQLLGTTFVVTDCSYAAAIARTISSHGR